MTGFGSSQRSSGALTLRAEARSVNHRSLSLSVRLPDELARLEPAVSARARELFSRGRVSVRVHVERSGSAAAREVDMRAVEGWLELIRGLGSLDGVEGGITAAELLNLPGVLAEEGAQRDDPRLADSVLACASEALEALHVERETEGTGLRELLLGSLTELAGMLGPVAERTAASVEARFERARQRASELSADATLDEERLMTELAILADRSDVTEELQRMEIHLERARELLETGSGPLGRELDFLLQEMHRELNTTGSKVDDASLSHRVIGMKNLLASMREQVANVE